MQITVKMLNDEHWWGGTNEDGDKMPFDSSTDISHDFTKNAPNETMPFYISDCGRYIWCESAFKVTVCDGLFKIDAPTEVFVETAGNTLKEAFVAARQKYFPIDKRVLNRDFFKTVQYNTWIECLYDPTQEHVMSYAKAIVKNGFEPGILMIDEGWHGRYGYWEFDKLKFPNPKQMVDELHEMGFKVLLWIVPTVCPDGKFFMDNLKKSNANDPEDERLFMRRKSDKYLPALIFWWNGFSAILNLKNKTDFEFLDNQLQYLMREYGIDGFKFDGGSVDMYNRFITDEPSTSLTASELNTAWNVFAAKYDYHEFKDTFKGATHATIQRLHDRRHSWNGNGINSIIPRSIAQGIIGHPFICPDMVGGGAWSDFLPGKEIDQELFVRWAQCSALFPMMQYSKAPWDCLTKENCRLVIEAGKLHKRFTDTIIEMVARAEQTGEPILRNLEYNYPHSGYESINDEFMLEDSYLVAPVVTKNTFCRKVVLPSGKWLADDGKTYDGNAEYSIDCPIDRLIWFKKL